MAFHIRINKPDIMKNLCFFCCCKRKSWSVYIFLYINYLGAFSFGTLRNGYFFGRLTVVKMTYFTLLSRYNEPIGTYETGFRFLPKLEVISILLLMWTLLRQTVSCSICKTQNRLYICIDWSENSGSMPESDMGDVCALLWNNFVRKRQNLDE